MAIVAVTIIASLITTRSLACAALRVLPAPTLAFFAILYQMNCASSVTLEAVNSASAIATPTSRSFGLNVSFPSAPLALILPKAARTIARLADPQRRVIFTSSVARIATISS